MKHVNDDLLANVRARFPQNPPARIGIAVSGGGDSVALMHLLSRSFGRDEVQLFAATVDHGLRPEAAAEAAQVGVLAHDIGVPHTVLTWTGWDGAGNLQDQARRARYALLTQWAKDNRIGMIVTAHTADDQAETILMRLARASGVDGLSGMPEIREENGVVLFRPLLHVERACLRDYLGAQSLEWVEDPSNEDTRFDRIKARQALAALEPLGLTTQALTDVATHMAQARDALERQTSFVAQVALDADAGDVLIDREVFDCQPVEIARRLLVGAVQWVGGGEYPPRRQAVQEAMQALLLGNGAVLAGCRLLVSPKEIRVCREHNAVKTLVAGSDETWDGRWLARGPSVPGAQLRALGEEGLAYCSDWRATGRPHASVIASPSVWVGDTLVAAPLAGLAQEWALERLGGEEGLFGTFLSH